MPSHLKCCALCGDIFAPGETQQPHPSASGIGYSKVHKRCAAKLTRKGQAGIVATTPAPVDAPVQPTPVAPVPAPVAVEASPSLAVTAPEPTTAEATEGQATEDAAMQAIEDAEVADIEKKEKAAGKHHGKAGKHK